MAEDTKAEKDDTIQQQNPNSSDQDLLEDLVNNYGDGNFLIFFVWNADTASFKHLHNNINK